MEEDDVDCCEVGSATRDPATDTYYCDGCGSRVPVPGSAYDGTGPHRYRVEARDARGQRVVIGHTSNPSGGGLRRMLDVHPTWTFYGVFDTAPVPW
jgi:hypothetical protein